MSYTHCHSLSILTCTVHTDVLSAAKWHHRQVVVRVVLFIQEVTSCSAHFVKCTQAARLSDNNPSVGLIVPVTLKNYTYFYLMPDLGLIPELIPEFLSPGTSRSSLSSHTDNIFVSATEKMFSDWSWVSGLGNIRSDWWEIVLQCRSPESINEDSIVGWILMES